MTLPHKWSFLATLFSMAFACVAAEEEEHRFLSKVFAKIKPRHDKVVLELRGEEGGEGWGATEASIVWPSGEGTVLASPGTYIEYGTISDDGSYIVLNYHVSSGGYYEAFERTKSGYRLLLGNGYARQQVKAGRVAGLRVQDIPQVPGYNIHYGLGFARSPDRLCFTFGRVIQLTYSLEKRRITRWERRLLENRITWDNASFSLSIKELSPDRRVALVAEDFVGESDNDLIRRTVLATFPALTPPLPDGKVTGDLRVKRAFGNGGFIELVARKLDDVKPDWTAHWQVEIAGAGQEFSALQKQLGARWKTAFVFDDDKSQWPAPEKFLASPPFQ